MPNAIKRRLWLETDRAYRAAAERFIRIKTNTQVKVAAEDDSDDFSTEKPPRSCRRRPEAQVRRRAVEGADAQALRRASGITRACSPRTCRCHGADGNPLPGQHRRHAGRAWPRVRPHRRSSASAKAADGTDLQHVRDLRSRGRSRAAGRQGAARRDRPRGQRRHQAAEGARGRAVRRTRDLLRDAPRASSSTRSSATAWRATGRRTKAKARRSPRASAPRCCPISCRVVFDPTRRKIGGIDLNGWYEYDDEGVKGQTGHGGRQGRAEDVPDVALADQGLRAIERARAAAAGLEVVSRQSNLIVESSNAVPEARLRQMLIDEVEEAEQALRPVLPRHHRRLHHHAAAADCRRSR